MTHTSRIDAQASDEQRSDDATTTAAGGAATDAFDAEILELLNQQPQESPAEERLSPAFPDEPMPSLPADPVPGLQGEPSSAGKSPDAASDGSASPAFYAQLLAQLSAEGGGEQQAQGEDQAATSAVAVPNDGVRRDEAEPISGQLPAPYCGLRPFTARDQANFFGRDEDASRLVMAIRQNAGTVLVGPSGVGKTSLIAASLVPWLGTDQDFRWICCYLRFGLEPNGDPFRTLAKALLPFTSGYQDVSREEDASRLAETLRKGEASLSDVLHNCQAMSPGARILLIADDFDTVLTQVDDALTRRRLIDTLLAAFQAEQAGARLLLVLRAESLERALQYRELAGLIGRNTLHLSRPRHDDLEKAIVRPLEQVAVEVDAEVVDAVLNEMEDLPDGLPLMQFCLGEMWRNREGTLIGIEAYRAVGGVAGSIEQRMEAIWNDRARGGRSSGIAESFRRLYRGLSAANGLSAKPYVRASGEEGAWALASELASMPNPVIAITTDGEAQIAELAHECVLRHWSRPAQWRTEQVLFEEWLRNLSSSVDAWKADPNNDELLLKGPTLAQAEDWFTRRPDGLRPIERAFIERSIADRKQKEDDQRRAAEREVEQAQQMRTQADDLAEARSREAEESVRRVRRNRIVATLAITMSVASVGMSFLSWTQLGTARWRASEAERQIGSTAKAAADARQREAEAQKRLEQAIARARELAQDRTAMIVGLALRDIAQGQAERGLRIALEARPASTEGTKIDDFAQLTSAIERARYVGIPLLRHDMRKFNLAVAWSPDGKWLATANDDRTATLWDVASGQRVRSFFGHSDSVLAVSFDTDGKRLLTASEDGSAKLWDVASARELASFAGHPGPVAEAALSPDGLRVITACDDGVARLWDAATGEQLRIFTGHSAPIRSVAFSPDGKRVATASGDRTTRIWDISNSAELRRLGGHTQLVTAVRFSPDGSRAVTASADRSLRIWNTDTGAELRTLAGHTARVAGVAYSRDGKNIVSASEDRTVRWWDADTGAARTLATASMGFAGAALDPDGKAVVTVGSDGVVQVRDLASGNELRQLAAHTDKLRTASVMAGGQWIASISDDGTLRIWDAKTGSELKRLAGQGGLPRSLAATEGGKILVLASEDRSVRLWAVDSGEPQVLASLAAAVTAVAISRDGKRVATLSDDRNIRIWDPVARRELRAIVMGTTAGVLLALDATGQRVAAGFADGSLRIWETATGKELLSLQTAGGPMTSLAFAPDDATIATGSSDGTWAIWRLDTGAALRTGAEKGASVTVLGFSDNARRLVIGRIDGRAQLARADNDGAVDLPFGGDASAIVGFAFTDGGLHALSVTASGIARQWDTEHGHEIVRMAGHGSALTSAAVLPDGKQIVTVSEDRTARIWDAHTGGELRRLGDHPRGIAAVAVSPRGDRIATASHDGIVRLWDANGALVKNVAGQTGGVFALTFSPKGDRLVTGGEDRQLRILDATSGAEVRRIAVGGPIRSIAVSPDGKRIISAAGEAIGRVWDADTGRPVMALAGHAATLRGVAWSQDGKWIATASDDATVRLWNSSTGSAQQVLRGHGGAVGAVAFGSGGRRLLSGGDDRTIRLWDSETGIPLHTFVGHAGPVTAVEFMPDARRFVSASQDRTARVWGTFSPGEAWEIGFIDQLRPLMPSEKQAVLRSE